MLNVTKAKLLQAQVGNQVGKGTGEQKIWHHANILYRKANTLATAQNLRAQGEEADPHKELRELAEALENAVGANESAPNSLQKALQALNSANEDSDIVEKAHEVVKKYNVVAEKYQAVKAKEINGSAYTNALKGGSGNDEQKYTQVTQAFGQLKQKFNAGKCKAISLTFDKEYIR